MSQNLTLTDLLIEKAKREEKYFKNYLKYAKLIKKEAEKFLGEVRVLIFGSILKKDEVPRDIDILIISPQLKTSEKKSEIREKIFKKIGNFSPFEIHLITPQEYKDWYSHFIKEKIEIK